MNQPIGENKKIFFYISNDFPEGNSKNARIKCYAAGLQYLNYQTHVFVGFSSKFNTNAINTQKQGNWFGISYRFLNYTVKYPNNLFKKIISWIYYNMNAIKYLFINRKAYHFFYLPNFNGLLIPFLFASLFQLKLVAIQTELNTKLENADKLKKIEELLVAKSNATILTVTSYIKQFYTQYNSKTKSIIPIVTDMKRFENVSLNHNNTLGFCGSFGRKQEIDTIVNAYNAQKSNLDLKQLNFIGYISDNSIGNYENVIFTGSFTHEKLPNLLQSCDTLIVNRINDDFAKYGFPIKLAEYLATGIPVLLCDFEEYRQYLSEEEVIYFKANDQESLENALKFRYENYELVNNIGTNGKIACERLFSQSIVAMELSNIIQTI